MEPDQQEELDQNLTSPVNETFGVVWPVIYTGISGLAVHQALPVQHQNQRYEQAQSWFRVSFALNALFGYFFPKSGLSRRMGLSLTTISLLLTAIKLHRKLRIGQTPVAQPERASRTSVSLYAGWLTTASVVSVGHSRGGKVALWCGAQDQRFAITISNNSGRTGAALSRRKVGETVATINQSFPYWFGDDFNKFNEKEETLPIYQHMLIAIMAPRAVYVASASEDAWADPVGEFLALIYAEPVFGLFQLSPLPVMQQPPIQTPVKISNLGYHLRKGGHGLYLYDWGRFIDFGDTHYGTLTK